MGELKGQIDKLEAQKHTGLKACNFGPQRSSMDLTDLQLQNIENPDSFGAFALAIEDEQTPVDGILSSKSDTALISHLLKLGKTNTWQELDHEPILKLNVATQKGYDVFLKQESKTQHEPRVKIMIVFPTENYIGRPANLQALCSRVRGDPAYLQVLRDLGIQTQQTQQDVQVSNLQKKFNSMLAGYNDKYGKCTTDTREQLDNFLENYEASDLTLSQRVCLNPTDPFTLENMDEVDDYIVLYPPIQKNVSARKIIQGTCYSRKEFETFLRTKLNTSVFREPILGVWLTGTNEALALIENGSKYLATMHVRDRTEANGTKLAVYQLVDVTNVVLNVLGQGKPRITAADLRSVWTN